ncbi:hypothetical protein TNCV_4622631 [Trichonephila clavipes]|nr:hypothetical protein TNCV_4622631 [Trichonephila clavipes]
MDFFVSLRLKQDGGKGDSLGFVKRIRNGMEYFKQNGAPFLLSTVNKSASGIKEIILGVCLSNQKNSRVIFRYEDRAGFQNVSFRLLQPFNFTPSRKISQNGCCSKETRVVLDMRVSQGQNTNKT